MSHSFVLQGSRMQLINQLVYFDDQQQEFLDQYFPGTPKDRVQIEQVLSEYSKTLENILSEFTQDQLNSTVLIGSQMKLLYIEGGFTETFTVVFPHQAEPSQNKISFLSPVGIQLLLGKVNQTYQIKNPSGGVEVRLEEIKYNNCGDLEQ